MQIIFRYLIGTIFLSLAFSQQLDITSLETLVIKGNPDLLVSKKNIDISIGQLEQSKTLPNPEIDFESGAGIDPETIGMVSQTILLGGKRKKKIALSELELNKVQLEYEALKQTILTEAFREFVVILYLQENKILQQERISVAKDLLNAVSRKVEAGKLSTAEKSRAKIQLIQEQLTLRTIDKFLKTAWNSISALWGNGGTSFNYSAGDLSSIGNIPSSFSFDNTPDILISKLSLEIKKTNVLTEKANAIPNLQLGAGLKRSDIPGNTYQVGLSIPLPIFNRNKGNINSAVSELEQARLELNAIEIELKTKVSNLQTELEILTSEIAILNKDIIPEAQNAYAIITEGYLTGRFNYLDVVNAQEIWFQSREQYLTALKEYHQNIFELDRLIGNTNHSNL
ncbi:MAG: TolC family protein [Planctomycetia bacterium]|nr:TolC family protein [Planctomycetia bacterium]